MGCWETERSDWHREDHGETVDSVLRPCILPLPFLYRFPSNRNSLALFLTFEMSSSPVHRVLSIGKPRSMEANNDLATLAASGVGQLSPLSPLSMFFLCSPPYFLLQTSFTFPMRSLIVSRSSRGSKTRSSRMEASQPSVRLLSTARSIVELTSPVPSALWLSHIFKLLPFDNTLFAPCLPPIAPKGTLRCVCGPGAGFDKVPLDYFNSERVFYANTPESVAEPTAAHVVILVLTALRGTTGAERSLRRGEWTSGGDSVANKTLGRSHPQSLVALLVRTLTLVRFVTSEDPRSDSASVSSEWDRLEGYIATLCSLISLRLCSPSPSCRSCAATSPPSE